MSKDQLTSGRGFWRRFVGCARFDFRWAVAVAEWRRDWLEVRDALGELVRALILIPMILVITVFRWPLRPLWWVWFSWRRAADVERVIEVREARK